MKWHHCKILKKYKLLSFDSFIKFSFITLNFKRVNNFSPAVLCPYVTKMNTNRIATRGSTNGNCRVAQRKTTFGQSSFSVKGKHFWNALPTEIKIQPDLKTFNEKVKHWLKLNQTCDH